MLRPASRCHMACNCGSSYVRRQRYECIRYKGTLQGNVTRQRYKATLQGNVTRQRYKATLQGNVTRERYKGRLQGNVTGEGAPPQWVWLQAPHARGGLHTWFNRCMHPCVHEVFAHLLFTFTCMQVHICMHVYPQTWMASDYHAQTQ